MPSATRPAAIVAWLFLSSILTMHPTSAQVLPATPQDKFILHDQHPVDRFVVQRWIDKESPEVSPAGYCECLTVIYEGAGRVLTVGPSAGSVAVEALADVTGDMRKELVVTIDSGGAHCCYSTNIYSIEAGRPKTLLEAETGNCAGEMIDLDKDGIVEFSACDDAFAYAFCSFALSPLPPVVFAYNHEAGKFLLATPKFSKYLQRPSADDARKTMQENRDDPSIARCAALAPALALMYTGQVAEGQRLFRQLYRRSDAREVEQKAVAAMMKSPLWVRQ